MNQSSTANKTLTGIKEISPVTGTPDPAFAQLEKSILTALERYSNVHRGSGHFSKVTTHLYEKAREILLAYMGLEKNRYQVIFLSPRRATAFSRMLKPGSFRLLQSLETGLLLGVDAVMIEKPALY